MWRLSQKASQNGPQMRSFGNMFLIKSVFFRCLKKCWKIMATKSPTVVISGSKLPPFGGLLGGPNRALAPWAYSWCGLGSFCVRKCRASAPEVWQNSAKWQKNTDNAPKLTPRTLTNDAIFGARILQPAARGGSKSQLTTSTNQWYVYACLVQSLAPEGTVAGTALAHWIIYNRCEL